MINGNEKRRARILRRTIFTSFIFLFFVFVLFSISSSAQDLFLPIILGVFFGYLFRPLIKNITGSPFAKLAKGCLLLAVIVGGIYASGKMISASLPNEKEKLELLVRLKYRINLRYNTWMGLTENKEKGNWAHNLMGKELDPLLKQVNQFLSLDSDQKKKFIKYRKGYNDLPPVSDKYYQYFLANRSLYNKLPVTDEEAALPDEPTERDPASAHQAPGAGLAHMMKLLSTWLIFPLVFVFVLLDRGQIFQFLIRMVPNRYFELTKTIADEVDRALGHYIRGTLLECLLVGLTISIGLWICGFSTNIVVLVGVIGGLTNAIPFVGPAMALAVGSGFALIAEQISPMFSFITLENLFVAVLVVVAVAQFLDNAVYQPIVVGGAVNIHPLAVILGVFGGSLAFGFAGLLLAIPTIVILKVVTETLFHELKAYKII